MGQSGRCNNRWLFKSDWKNVGLLKRMQDKVTEINPVQKWTFLHCIIHQEVLCKIVLKMDHVVDVVIKTVHQSKSIKSQTIYCSFGGK